MLDTLNLGLLQRRTPICDLINTAPLEAVFQCLVDYHTAARRRVNDRIHSLTELELEVAIRSENLHSKYCHCYVARERDNVGMSSIVISNRTLGRGIPCTATNALITRHRCFCYSATFELTITIRLDPRFVWRPRFFVPSAKITYDMEDMRGIRTRVISDKTYRIADRFAEEQSK